MRLSLSTRALAFASLATFLLSLGCVKPSSKRPESLPAPVVVTTVATKSMPMLIRSIGTVKSISTYLVKPRVGGELTQVHFREGDDVKKGQKLFTIDPRQYENALERAAATLDKDQALLSGAIRDLERVERAVRSGVASREDLDEAQTKVASAKASVAADEAALHAAKLQLSFTTILSPIEGRTGELHITPGNLVSPTDMTHLAVVVQISPIDVIFSLPEHLLPQVDAARKVGPLSVTVTPRNGESAVTGTLAFSDNTVDTTTGSVQLKAHFKNEERKLWPGQFVDVVLTTGVRPNCVVVPAAAVQSGQAGPYVFLLDKEGKAEIRPITIGFQEAGEAVIEKGLKGGETLVVDGQIRLAPGVKADVKKTLPSLESKAVAEIRVPRPELPVAPAPRTVEGASR